ncbi:MAG TPA: alkaline phosphatase family protein [Allosphingosinicella sp.]|nr:alkaline phosphatase family protein [Allosphingosinicella sp.]
MRLKHLAALLALAGCSPAPAQPPAPPRLIVAISVDQLSADLFAEYRQHFTGGLRRLSEGAVFPAGYQSHAATETCPGHSTILTGARPARTGIVANNWTDLGAARADKYIYCAEDERVAGSDSDHYTVSPVHLRVPALGDLMRRADPRSRVVAVAGKDRAAVMMGGHDPNERWWWSGGGFVSHAGHAVPGAVAGINDQVAGQIGAAREAAALPPLCATRSQAVAAGSGRSVGDGRFARASGDADAFRASPEFDNAILALARQLRADMRLGQGPATDLLAIGLSATDYVGHRYGTQGSEMCLQMLALDRALDQFFEALDRAGIDYAVVLTADHGGLDLPERARLQGMPDAARVDPALRANAMNDALAARLGLTGRILYGDGPFGDMYVTRAVPEPVRARILGAAIAAYRGHPQVAAVFTRAEIAAAPSPTGPPDAWSLLQRARASFDPQRSGDFYVMLRPLVTPIASPGASGAVATHGSPWDYDRRVPILFWRRGLAGFEQPIAVETVDIMPSLAALIGLPLARGSVDGRCLDLVAGPESSCPR